MDGDPGLAPQPWVEVTLDDGSVLVDGRAVGGGGAVEDRYLLALQEIAQEIATPLARQVGVTVSDRNGPVRHLAIHPDGRAEDIDSLVREAAGGLAAAEPATHPDREASPPGTVTPEAAPARHRGALRRRISWAAVAALGVALLVGGVAAVASVMTGTTPTEPMALTTPTSGATGPEAPTASATRVVTKVVTRWRRPHTALVAEVAPAGLHRVAFLIGATARPLRVTVTVDSEGGAPVTQRLVLRGGIERLVLKGVPGGQATWRIEAPGARPLTGSLLVPPGYVPPATVAPVAPSTSPPPAGGGSGHSGGGGHTPLPPEVTPIDPDDQ